MERKITLTELRDALYGAYDQLKNSTEGAIDPRLDGVDTSNFGISLALADGTIINRGDAGVKAPLGGIARVPIASLLLEQIGPEGIIEKAGNCKGKKESTKPAVHGAKPIRAVSALEPIGDPDSKWNFIENRMISLMGSTPELDLKLYEASVADIDSQVNALAEANFYLYDDAALSIDLYRRAKAMKASAEQLAIMGATIAADGVNPVTRKIVYDGRLSKHIVGMMAAKGPKHMARPWDMLAGLPALSSFSGLFIGVYPGVFAVAAYSPLLNEAGISIRAARTIAAFMRKLDISVFQSAALTIDKEK